MIPKTKERLQIRKLAEGLNYIIYYYDIFDKELSDVIEDIIQDCKLYKCVIFYEYDLEDVDEDVVNRCIAL